MPKRYRECREMLATSDGRSMTIVSILIHIDKLPMCMIVGMLASHRLRMLNARDYAYATVAMLCQHFQNSD